MEYIFSEIPNNEEGRQLITLMRKYLNKEDYRLRARGQYRDHAKLKEGEAFKTVARWSLPITHSKNIRVYIDRK
jgi:hypothetical protein